MGMRDWDVTVCGHRRLQLQAGAFLLRINKHEHVMHSLEHYFLALHQKASMQIVEL